MAFKSISAQLNIFSQCRKYGVPIQQCPQFIFLVMGIVIIATMLAIYLIGLNCIGSSEIVALIVLTVTMILLILSFIVEQSFERLAEASRMKSEFINIVSHQLRSPLINLKWAVEFLTTETANNISKKQTEYFTILEENCARMNELINDLLTVSRLEQKKITQEKQGISLYDLLNNIISKVKPFAIASNIEIKLKADKNLPKIFIDHSYLNTIMENFIDNAIRYSPVHLADKEHQGLIEIKLEQKQKNIYFEVKDNGIGIPEQDQKYIFQKFFRSRNASQYQKQGTGFGLYITKSIVEKSGGKIGFVSEQGKGTTFWLTLPINPV